jgi:hypothetical protein
MEISVRSVGTSVDDSARLGLVGDKRCHADYSAVSRDWWEIFLSPRVRIGSGSRAKLNCVRPILPFRPAEDFWSLHVADGAARGEDRGVADI